MKTVINQVERIRTAGFSPLQRQRVEAYSDFSSASDRRTLKRTETRAPHVARGFSPLPAPTVPSHSKSQNRARDERRSGLNAARRFGAVFGLTILCLLFAGCAKTRSISHSTYSNPEFHHAHSPGEADNPAFAYRGELNEFDVLGVDRARVATEEEINRALDEAKAVELKPGSRVLLVQSGATIPDDPMVSAMEKHFHVVPFSGVPPHRRAATDPEPSEMTSYSRNLRLTAARAGAEMIVCYWGTLESARRKLETKTVSWVPIAGWVVPDESQHMRIRLKVALVDVRTGNWRVVTPEPFTDRALSTAFTRGSSDQKQVELLKQKAYEAGVKLLATR